MDLKIKDVAELLDVSETTIRRWLVDGKIPAYRLNHQYRFSREEIDNWMIRCRLKSADAPASEAQAEPIHPLAEEGQANRAGLHQFSLYRAIHQGVIFTRAPGRTKEDIIRITTSAIAGKLGVDADVLSELLLDRERMMPTALNQGIAVPHTRDFLTKGPLDTVVVVFPESPIEYGALDGLPVHTLFFLFACTDKRHLHLLAKIAHLCSNPDAIDLLRSQPNKERLLGYIRHWEGNLVGNKR